MELGINEQIPSYRIINCPVHRKLLEERGQQNLTELFHLKENLTDTKRNLMRICPPSCNENLSPSLNENLADMYQKYMDADSTFFLHTVDKCNRN